MSKSPPPNTLPKALDKACGSGLWQNIGFEAFHGLEDSDRRAAELLSGALVQLISAGKRSDVEDLINQSMRWIKQEIKAPGCPQH